MSVSWGKLEEFPAMPSKSANSDSGSDVASEGGSPKQPPQGDGADGDPFSWANPWAMMETEEEKGEAGTGKILSSFGVEEVEEVDVDDVASPPTHGERRSKPSLVVFEGVKEEDEDEEEGATEGAAFKPGRHRPSAENKADRLDMSNNRLPAVGALLGGSVKASIRFVSKLDSLVREQRMIDRLKMRKRTMIMDAAKAERLKNLRDEEEQKVAIEEALKAAREEREVARNREDSERQDVEKQKKVKTEVTPHLAALKMEIRKIERQLNPHQRQRIKFDSPVTATPEQQKAAATSSATSERRPLRRVNTDGTAAVEASFISTAANSFIVPEPQSRMPAKGQKQQPQNQSMFTRQKHLEELDKARAAAAAAREAEDNYQRMREELRLQVLLEVFGEKFESSHAAAKQQQEGKRKMKQRQELQHQKEAEYGEDEQEDEQGEEESSENDDAQDRKKKKDRKHQRTLKALRAYDLPDLNEFNQTLDFADVTLEQLTVLAARDHGASQRRRSISPALTPGSGNSQEPVGSMEDLLAIENGGPPSSRASAQVVLAEDDRLRLSQRSTSPADSTSEAAFLASTNRMTASRSLLQLIGEHVDFDLNVSGVLEDIDRLVHDQIVMPVVFPSAEECRQAGSFHQMASFRFNAATNRRQQQQQQQQSAGASRIGSQHAMGQAVNGGAPAAATTGARRRSRVVMLGVPDDEEYDHSRMGIAGSDFGDLVSEHDISMMPSPLSSQQHVSSGLGQSSQFGSGASSRRTSGELIPVNFLEGNSLGSSASPHSFSSQDASSSELCPQIAQRKAGDAELDELRSEIAELEREEAHAQFVKEANARRLAEKEQQRQDAKLGDDDDEVSIVDIYYKKLPPIENVPRRKLMRQLLVGAAHADDDDDDGDAVAQQQQQQQQQHPSSASKVVLAPLMPSKKKKPTATAGNVDTEEEEEKPSSSSSTTRASSQFAYGQVVVLGHISLAPPWKKKSKSKKKQRSASTAASAQPTEKMDQARLSKMNQLATHSQPQEQPEQDAAAATTQQQEEDEGEKGRVANAKQQQEQAMLLERKRALREKRENVAQRMSEASTGQRSILQLRDELDRLKR